MPPGPAAQPPSVPHAPAAKGPAIFHHLFLGAPLPPHPGIALFAAPLPESLPAKLFRLEKQQSQVQELMRLYHLCCKHGLFDEAQKIALKTCELDPNNVAALAAVHVAARLKEKSQPHDSAKAPSNGPSANHGKGIPATPTSQPKQQSEKPGKVSRLIDRAGIYCKKGNHAEAEQCAAKACTMAPDCSRLAGCIGQAEIERRLALPVCISFQGAPLGQVLAALHEITGIDVQIDVGALMEAHIDPAVKVNLDLNQVSLNSALGLMLHQAHLTYVIKDGIVVIMPNYSLSANPD
jgi:hypothetical protein